MPPGAKSRVPPTHQVIAIAGRKNSIEESSSSAR
jgi:hypothetical protein